MEAVYTIASVATDKQFKDFVKVPAKLYKAHPGFAPAPSMAEKQLLSAAKNPVLKSNPHKTWLAYRDNYAIGRIAAIIDHSYNAKFSQSGQEKTGFFGFFDCENCPNTGADLLNTAEKWLKDQGCTRMEGPYHFTINQMAGLLVEGHETESFVRLGYQSPWLQDFLVTSGFHGVKDLVCYRGQVSDMSFPERFKNLFATYPEKDRLSIKALSPSNLFELFPTLIDVYNDAYADNWGATPVSTDEAAFIARMMRPALYKDWVILGCVDGAPMGLLAQIPNIDEAMAGGDGSLLSLQGLKLGLKLAGKRWAGSRIPIIGIRRELKGSKMGAMLSSLMLSHAIETARKADIKTLEISWMLADNNRILNMVSKLQTRYARRYSIFEKNISV
jgi:hypothetical protein